MIYDDFSRNSLKNYKFLLENNNVETFKGSILDLNKLKTTIEKFKPNIVIHLAAVAGIDTVIKNPIKTMQVNMIGTFNVLESIKNIEVERFINFSTSEVFGSYAYKVDENNTTNLAPVGEARWTYSVSKLAGEHLAFSYFKEKGIPIVNIRPFNIYGPGQVGEGAIHQFIVRAIRNEEIQIHGDGDQIRSWCYIDDFINGVILCLEKEQAIGHTFNIGNPRGTITIGMLAKLISDIAKSKSPIVYVTKNYVDVELRIPSIEKAITILGYKPKIDLEEGIQKTINWYRGVIND
ncbi:dTDP-glucose 4,6-dehydratase 2 [Caloramator mitchellensis]|uniref:dTDP-glucose 4,6-dehydratase 2 n=2 Tax=Caloramator mitchellensis TaxID=908809 RepID=A0A0R3K0J2_CALMK|nr:dTDP-glucose 4,6-dehydratase 2 [Caloramator mitchellensis]